jgi:methylmalonyl-CoA mutase N-terminal domain/subunit
MSFSPEELREIEEGRRAWEESTYRTSLERLGESKDENRFYTPLDIKDFNFVEKVGFPGQPPYTAGEYAVKMPGSPEIEEKASLTQSTFYYSGYGTPEDTRDYYKQMQAIGQRVGPNLAFDLPTQLGLDSDNPLAVGEVGRTGVVIDSLRDMEVVYEVFVNDLDLDKIASSWTINAPASIITAMYIVLAKKRGIPLNKLRGTPQNDILKEYIARGTYIFPPKPAMRLTRDMMVYLTKNMPLFNLMTVAMSHIESAGVKPEELVGIVISNGIAYVQTGIEAGLDVDVFVKRLPFLAGAPTTVEIYKEIARARAFRRIWAKVMKERFGAKDPRSCMPRGAWGLGVSGSAMVPQRCLNNLTRSVIIGVADAMAGGRVMLTCYDEPLELGHSLEGRQLNYDAERIIRYEARLLDVRDPWAGSYFMEALTDEVESKALEIIHEIDKMGGAVAAVEAGYQYQICARSSYEQYKKIFNGERIIVGVNRFVGPHELDVTIERHHPYDATRRENAEERQLASLGEVKRNRSNEKVQATLKRLEEAAKDEAVNLMPLLVESVEEYATLGEICGTLGKVFGKYGGTRL